MDNIAEFCLTEKPVSLLIEKAGNSVRIKEQNFSSCWNRGKQEKGNKREIKEFSLRSQRNAKFKFESAASGMETLITLTYPVEIKDSLDGRQSKYHFQRFMQEYCRKFGKETRYTWVLEFQKNGNPHYHITTDCKADLKAQIDFVSETWYLIVGSGLEKHFRAGTKVEKVISKQGLSVYLAKYLSKINQKTVPPGFHNVGRFWGGSRNAFQVETELRVYEDSMVGVADARRCLRIFRKYRLAKLKIASRENGKKYNLGKKKSGGFVCWGGLSAFEQLMKFQDKNSQVPF